MPGQAREQPVQARDMIIDADFAANASNLCAPIRADFDARRWRHLAPDKPPRFEYTSASVELQRLSKVA
jgi:hypothetical protein